MSGLGSDWWLNNIGAFSAASTPDGGTPQFGVAYDVGTAAWPSATAAQNFNAATAKVTHGPAAQQAQAAQQQQDSTWFSRRLTDVGHFFMHAFGDVHSKVGDAVGEDPYETYVKNNPNPMSRAEFQKLDPEKQSEAIGTKAFDDVMRAPGIKQFNEGYGFATRVAATPFILDKYTGQQKSMGLWTDQSSWARAWREADERTLAQAVVDDVLTGAFGQSEKDLDRIRRTNSLYGMTTFAGDLYFGAKLDPTVLAGKVGGEVAGLAKGKLPVESSSLRAEALRTARGQAPTKTINPLTRWASYRGQKVAVRFDDLREYAKTHTVADMVNLPMFRRQAVNGAQAALAFKLAANDDKLWDLTQRAVLADDKAWKTIGVMKHQTPEELQAFAPRARTYLDAIDATKTKMGRLQDEVDDLQKQVEKAEANGPARPDSGISKFMYDQHVWELHRDIDAKTADIETAKGLLSGHEDYDTWLSKMPHIYGDDPYRGPVTSIDQVSTKLMPSRYDGMKQHTYQDSAYGAVHQINQIGRATWMNKANPIDLNRVDSGVQSIRRQFEQFNHLMGYHDPEGLDAAIEAFVRAPDSNTRFKIAKEIEDTHLVGALSQKFGLAPEAVDLFLTKTRLRRNEMLNAMLSGEGTVYSTGLPTDMPKIVSRKNGMAEIQVMDNGKLVTMRMPEEALERQDLPVDSVQTPNNYMPMDTRQVYLAVKRNNELFEALDKDVRQFGAKVTWPTMEAINKAGSTFNALWKPAQLFRLAWPQRVIMDEGLRHLAIVGTNAWFKNTGAAAFNWALDNIEHDLSLLSREKKVPIGPGPVSDAVSGQTIDTAAHEAATADAAWVPAYYAPQIHKERFAKLSEQVAANNTIQAVRNRFEAIMRNPNSQVSLPADANLGNLHDWHPLEQAVRTGPIWNTDFTLEDLAKAKPGEMSIDELLDGGSTFAQDLEHRDLPMAMGENASDASNFNYIEGLVARYGHGGTHRAHLEDAIRRGREEFDKELAHRKTGAGHRPLFSGVLHSLDTLAAQREMLMAKELGGTFVPVSYGYRPELSSLAESLPNPDHVGPMAEYGRRFEADINPNGRLDTVDAVTGKQVKTGYAVPVSEVTWDGSIPQLHDFIARNKELLGSNGYRIQLEKPEYTFENRGKNKLRIVRVFNSKEARKATDFGNHAGADSFHSLHEKNTHYIRDWNDKSPTMEALDRKFWNEEETALVPGEAPVAGKPGVYHGAGAPLPESLLPREDVPVAHGRMVGEGFYTTMDIELAKSYGSEHVYTIRGSKSGKKYRVFDMEKSMTPEERNALEEYMRAHYAEHAPDILEDNIYGTSPMNDVAADIQRSDTWLEVMEQAGYHYFNQGGGLTPQQLVSKYLEDVKGAGALTHTGGIRLGGKQHQVYVWLHPEDLDVKPAYQKTGKFTSLQAWLGHPDSREVPMNQVPENRIHRVGSRHPLLRDLETIHHKVEARAADLKRQRVSRYVDPEYKALLRQEQDLMHTVGADYTHNLSADEAKADHWYTITDPNRLKHHDYKKSLEGRTDLSPANEEMHGRYDDLDFNASIDSVHDAFMRKMFRRRQAYGSGYSTWTSGDGKRIVGEDAFHGVGQNYVPLISSNPVYTRLTDSYKRTLSRDRERAAGYKATPPPDVSAEALKTTAGRNAARDYYQSWADLLNEQIRNSPIWYRMLEGKSDDEIVNWLESTDEGARLRRELPHQGHRPEKWVEEHRQRLDTYLPDENLQAIMRDRQILPSELRNIHSQHMPTIYEPDLQLLSGKGPVGEWFKAKMDQIYHSLGTIPSDRLVRQPFFRSLYDLKMRNLVKATDAESLDNATMQAYHRLAREFALRQVKKNLYDLADETNMTQALRFLAPFWGAQQEAMVKWLGIAVEKPETVAKFYVGVNNVYSHFQVIDENGKPVKNHGRFAYNANDRVIIQIPQRFRDVEPFKSALKEFGSVGISFGAANTALQGDNPLLPSLGPLVTMPADSFLNMTDATRGTKFDNNFFYRWLFPVGRPDNGIGGKLEQMFPGWGRRAAALAQGEDSRMYTNTFWSVYREMELDNRKRGLPPPSMHDVAAAARWHMGLRILAAFGAPAAMEFRPKNQMWLDEYHKMQDNYGPDAFEKFVQKYGADAARYAASSSNSPEGIPPTTKAMDEWSKNKDLIQKYPDWGGAIISPSAWADDFSSDAYGAQFNIKEGPGSSKNLRELNDPQSRIDQTETRLGWLEYRQLTTMLDNALERDGFSSVNQKGAEYLKQWKKEQVAKIEKEHPAWATDFNTFDNTIYQRVEQLRSWAGDKQFDNRPDIQGVRQYFLIRDKVAAELDAYGARGGSRSLQAGENDTLRNWFEGQVFNLCQQNPAFGELYHRYLESDKLTRGSG